MAFKKKDLCEQLDEYAPNFIGETAKLAAGEIKGKIADISISDSEIEDAMREDRDLQKAKETLDTAKEGYNGMLTANRLKKKYLIRLLKDRANPAS